MVQNATQRSLPLLLCWWLCIPVLPVMLLQAKGVRKRVPRLPEAAGSRSGESQGDFSDDTFRVAIVGESTAVGVGADTQDEALPGHLARALASRLKKTVRWHVIGGNGMTLKRVVSEVRREHEKRYDAAVVLLGVNDVFRLTSVKAWLANLRLLAESLTERGCEVIVFSSVPPVGRFSALPQPLRAILGLRASLLDGHLETLTSDLPRGAYCRVRFPTGAANVASDGVHPSSDGYCDWAQQLAATIEAAISETRSHDKVRRVS